LKFFSNKIYKNHFYKGKCAGELYVGYGHMRREIYEVISYIHNKFNPLVSSGTVYSLLYSLERNSLVEGAWVERRRTYKLAEKGEKTIETILNANDKINGLLTSLLKV